MRLHKRVLAVISASLFLVAGLLPSVAVAEDTGPWAIGIYEFPKCLEVEGGSTANSAQVQLWSCDETKNHRTWYMQEVQSGWWHIKNTKSGKCLNVQGASKKDSAKVVQYTCQSVSKYNDQWQLLYSGVSGNNGDLYPLVCGRPHSANAACTAAISSASRAGVTARRLEVARVRRAVMV
jgi:Ricin-type beta-trefoil lectin domain